MNKFSHMMRIQLLALLLGMVLMGMKFFAYYLTQSNAILSDALESIINVAAGGFALFSIWVSHKPKDLDHPYGHGKIEFISSGFEGALIFIGGIYILYEAVLAFFYLPQVKQLSLGIYLVAISGFINFLMGNYLVKQGKSNHSDAMIADGKHLISDTYSSIGLVIGLILVSLTQLLWLDAFIALLMGGVILFTGYKIMRKSLAGLMDEANDEILDQLLPLLHTHRKKEWIDIHNLRVLKYGSNYHIDAHVTLPWYWSLEKAHEEISSIDSMITEKFHNQVELFIHADPCIPSSCSICEISDCLQRKHKFIAPLEWNKERVLKNQKHSHPLGVINLSGV
ncbi:MAG: cation diffusion facilitator family transporter [Bacteroidia bacterium]